MITYITLIIATAILALISYKLFKKDILSPSFIVSVTYFASIVAAFLAKIFNLWNNEEISFKIVSIIIIGIISFILGEFIIKKTISKLKKKKDINEDSNYKIIKISNIKMIIICVFLIITFINIFYQMVNITGISDNIPQMINAYREQTPLFNKEDSTISIDTFAMQMYRAADLFAVFFIFIIINNLLLKDKIKNNLKYCIPILISIIITLFVSGRTPLVKLFVSGFFMGVMLYRKYYNKEINIKLLLKIGTMLLLGILIIFYLVMPLIGRNQQTNIVNYITFYLGSPIPSFNELMDRGEVGNSEHFGQETFSGIQAFLNRFGLIDYYTPYESQWINFDGLYGNTFSGVRNYYSDFGIFGVIILQILFAIVVTTMYIMAKNNKSKFYMIFFTFFGAYMLIDQYRAEKMFGSFITLDTVIYFVYMIIIYIFLFKDKKDLKKLVNRGKEIINGERNYKKN